MGRKKKFWLVFGIVVLFLVVDVVVLSPQVLKSAKLNQEKLNWNIDNFTPVYSSTTQKSFPSLRSGYFYTIELVNQAKIKPVPKDVSKDKFLGYSKDGTRLRVVAQVEDPKRKEGVFQEEVGNWPLQLGTIKKTIPGSGDLKKYQMELELKIQERVMDVKLEKVGLLWNTYKPASVYYITMEVKKVRVINVPAPYVKNEIRDYNTSRSGFKS